MTEQITIEGIKYNVVKSRTAEDMDNEGLRNIAASMSKNHCVRQILMQRPNGKKFYEVNEFSRGFQIVYSKVLTIPSFSKIAGMETL